MKGSPSAYLRVRLAGLERSRPQNSTLEALHQENPGLWNQLIGQPDGIDQLISIQ